MSAQRAVLPGGRLHLQHGPMDVIVGAEGKPEALEQAHEHAWQRFGSLLAELVQELAGLRAPVGERCALQGGVARRMWSAAHPFREVFVTPMVAVAGAVAQELLTSYQRPGIRRAWVNNGGDIALHLTPGERFRVGLFADLDHWPQALSGAGLSLDGVFGIGHDSPVRGVATSGWKGRSFSLGIADSVTVLAASAAQADAAATIIANAVNVDDPAIVRAPANSVRDDTDLGAIAVTIEVPRLAARQVRAALAAGRDKALALRRAGLIVSCVLGCQGWGASTDGRAGEEIFLLPAQAPGQALRKPLQEIA